ncbi:O-antigen ligase family protein [Acidobacteriota bacterium]
MDNTLKIRPLYLSFSMIYFLAFCYFYFKYVPLIESFQAVLIPILLLIVTLTAINIRWGILGFIFVFPLINNLPYLFKIHLNIPHAPTALVLFLSFFWGWLIHNGFFFENLKANHPIFRPILLFALLIAVSGTITFFRYANFPPFFSDKIRELIVNVNGVRAGGALMSNVFSMLNYWTGFIFFAIIFINIRSRKFIKKALVVLSLSAFISLLFSLAQKYYSISFGNTPYWAFHNQINSTFKDPNSFGIFISAFIPLLMGMFFSFKKHFKLFPLFLIGLSLFVFPAIGSRSGLLGLGFSSLTFFLLLFFEPGPNKKKKIVILISIFLVMVLVVLSFSFFSKQTELHQRISLNLDLLAKKGPVKYLFTGRLDFWQAALSIIKYYPLTGVGVGAFVVEMPNYLKLLELRFRRSDSAENYFIQVGAELGIIGLLVSLWLFFGIIKVMKKSFAENSPDRENRVILYGVTAGVVSIFFNFFFHSYVGSFEVKYFFWLLVALIFVYARDSKKEEKSLKHGNKFKIMAIVLLLSFGVIHFWNSTHSLSIGNETEKYGWVQNFGLYQNEKDDRGFLFQWGKKTVGVTIDNLEDTVIFPIRAAHPDINKRPVRVKIFLADKHFRKQRLLKEITLLNERWIEHELQISIKPGEKTHLVFETNRIWQPQRSLGVPDPRWLAIAFGKFWYKHSQQIPERRIKEIQTRSPENWEGKFRSFLHSNGISKMKFSVHQKNAALRVHMRGIKAFDLGPYVIVRLDERIIGKTMLSEEEWISLVFTPEMDEGEHVLSVEFINDVNRPDLGQDRNFRLGDLEVIYLFNEE